MNKPNIRLGTDDRSLLITFLLMLSIGCIVQTGTTPTKIKKPDTIQTLSDVAFESFQNRDIVRAKKLRALKGTRFDAKRIAAIEAAGAEASQETWKPVADALAKRLDGISQTDQSAFDAVLEELAIGSERAGQ